MLDQPFCGTVLFTTVTTLEQYEGRRQGWFRDENIIKSIQLRRRGESEDLDEEKPCIYY